MIIQFEVALTQLLCRIASGELNLSLHSDNRPIYNILICRKYGSSTEDSHPLQGIAPAIRSLRGHFFGFATALANAGAMHE